MKRYSAISSEVYIERRNNLRKLMQPNSLAIVLANDQLPRSADQFYPFRQNPDLFYLTGLDQEEIALVIFKDVPGQPDNELLFIRETNEQIAVWEGEKYSMEQATEISGIKTVFWYSQFNNLLPSYILRCENLYLNMNEHPRMHSLVPEFELRFARDLRNHYPLHNFHRLAPVLHGLRAIKSELEIQILRKACEITESAFRRILSFVKPGVKEFEIEAEIIHEFIRNGATGHAYSPIIASGRDSCVLHYTENAKVCQTGDILLMDFGAEYGNYAADLSRTIPVNGRFTNRQKEVYNANLRVMKYAKEILRPGITLEKYNSMVGEFMQEELIKLGLLNPEEVRANPDKKLYKKYFMHGTSHFLGLDVHDVGNSYLPVSAGMVFTVEPGIYIREEGLGIRLENDIWIGETINIDLMETIPLEAEEIEDLMLSGK